MKKFTSFVEADEYTAEMSKTYGQKLKHYVLSLMEEKNEQEAEDILQTIFLNLLITIRNKRLPLDSPFAYLCKAAKHLYFKTSSGQKSVSLSLETESTTDGRQIVLKELLDHQQECKTKERLEQVTEQIQAIRQPAVKATMELLSQGKSKEEISHLLRQSPKTTDNHISLGRGYLRHEASKLEGEER